ncbi:hypothetical protein PVAP13_4KG208900, partial [Panicum virgatum]
MAMASSTPTPRRRHTAAAANTVGEWAAVSAADEWRVEEEVGKHQLMRRTGLPARDLRALGPPLSHPSASILGRDRAVVVCLDRVRAVVTASEVLVPGPRDPAVAQLVRDLLARLGGGSAHTPTASPAPPQDGSATPPSGKDGQELGGGKVLPFELRALEVCLEFACKSREQETSTLEKEAYPALDELSSKISTLNLERVRQIKSRLVAISGRVQKVREELERLLDDDLDMAAMHLSEKLAYQAAGHSSRRDIEDEASASDEERDDDDDSIEEHGGSSRDGNDHGTSSTLGFTPRIDELEILLESYFVQVDGTLNKLSTLREYVEDTEDYINIMLDDKQNQLLQMGVMLSTGTLVITCGILVTGVLAMNIHIPLYKAPTIVFWQAAGGVGGGVVALYLMALL